ncbi:MAG: LacI family DNA-binding transcriptional regulator [Anaerolineae bacterium]
MRQARTNSHPTIADVAHRSGVSIATVSRVINRTAPVDAATAFRVQAAMHELRYTPREAARSLATRRTNTLGLLLSQLNNDFFIPLLTGVEAAVRAAGFHLLITTTGGRGAQDQLPPSLGAHNTDGLLVFAHTLSPAGLTACYESGLPVVLLHQAPPEGIAIPCVTVENNAAACHVVTHLVQAHHRRRIVFISGPAENEDSQRRQAGYREALEQHDLAFDPRLVIVGDFDRNVAYTAVRRLLSEQYPFDAVFASTDETAVGALAALREAGRVVPADVSVAGFDDQRLSAYMTPPLTTVRAPTEQVAHQAVRQLVRLIHGQTPEPMIVLPTELMLRQSCGCD